MLQSRNTGNSKITSKDSKLHQESKNRVTMRTHKTITIIYGVPSLWRLNTPWEVHYLKQRMRYKNSLQKPYRQVHIVMSKKQKIPLL